MTRTQKLAELESFKRKAMQEIILQKAMECKGSKVPFVLMGKNYSLEIKDEEEEEVLVEKFCIGIEEETLSFSMSFPTKEGIDILVGLFFALSEHYAIMKNYIIANNSEEEWHLSVDKFSIASDSLALRDFLIKEDKISFKNPNKVEREYYPSGAVKIEVEYYFECSDDKEGYAIEFSENGCIIAEYLVRGCCMTGIARFYREEGSLYKEACYRCDNVVWSEAYKGLRKYNGDIEGEIWANSLPIKIAECYGAGKEASYNAHFNNGLSKKEAEKEEDKDRGDAIESVHPCFCYEFKKEDASSILATLKENIKKAREICAYELEDYYSIVEEFTQIGKLDFLQTIEEKASSNMIDMKDYKLNIENTLKELYLVVLDDKVFMEILIGLKILESINRIGKCDFASFRL